jgi:hypothetical protein
MIMNKKPEDILTEVMVKTPITKKRIAELLCTALEGGSTDWYWINKLIKPKNFEFRFDPDLIYELYDYPLNEGGALIISDKEDDKPLKNRQTYRLDLESLKRGIQVIADKYPKHFNDFLQENDDSDTGDVFLQCCLFGEVIYG